MKTGIRLYNLLSDTDVNEEDPWSSIGLDLISNRKNLLVLPSMDHLGGDLDSIYKTLEFLFNVAGCAVTTVRPYCEFTFPDEEFDHWNQSLKKTLSERHLIEEIPSKMSPMDIRNHPLLADAFEYLIAEGENNQAKPEFPHQPANTPYQVYGRELAEEVGAAPSLGSTPIGRQGSEDIAIKDERRISNDNTPEKSPHVITSVKRITSAAALKYAQERVEQQKQIKDPPKPDHTAPSKAADHTDQDRNKKTSTESVDTAVDTKTKTGISDTDAGDTTVVVPPIADTNDTQTKTTGIHVKFSTAEKESLEKKVPPGSNNSELILDLITGTDPHRRAIIRLCQSLDLPKASILIGLSGIKRNIEEASIYSEVEQASEILDQIESTQRLLASFPSKDLLKGHYPSFPPLEIEVEEEERLESVKKIEEVPIRLSQLEKSSIKIPDHTKSRSHYIRSLCRRYNPKNRETLRPLEDAATLLQGLGGNLGQLCQTIEKSTEEFEPFNSNFVLQTLYDTETEIKLIKEKLC
ncbi:hypothetical protein [Coraliomargarita sinensis]|nr:hypothetical protein [Coraliomargarita sinensis]